MNSTEEQYFIQQIKDGNSDIFKEVYRFYYNPLCLFAYKYIDDKDEVEDIVQETMVYVWENRKKSTIENIKTYLFTAVKHACLNRLNHIKVVNRHKEQTALEIKLLELEHDDSFLIEEQKERQLLVEEMLASLPEQRQRIMRLRYIDGLSAKEIAEQTDISQRTVETHIYKAVKSLASAFGNKALLLLLLASFF